MGNKRTADSGSAYGGSNPSSSAISFNARVNRHQHHQENVAISERPSVIAMIGSMQQAHFLPSPGGS